MARRTTDQNIDFFDFISQVLLGFGQRTANIAAQKNFTQVADYGVRFGKIVFIYIYRVWFKIYGKRN
ncbi:hypothetical protein AO284_21125 [Pseudomonas sp. NZIPFR-PS2]|nr:hypothetical protein AO284_21125 [Pseudomonas sp. NZIPFR-PS2]